MSSAAISGRLALGTRRLLGRQWAAPATPTASLHATPSCQSSAVLREDGMYLKCILTDLHILALDFDLQVILSERSPFLTLRSSLKIKSFT